MAWADFVNKGFDAATSAIQNKRDKKAVEQERKRNLAMIKELDYEPMYASQTVPTFQKAKSPIARSYLESMLMGNNPDATFSGAPNAALTKQRQQASQNAMFGTPEQRMAQQRAANAATPWAVKTPTRKVVGDKADNAMWISENTAYGDKDINKNLHDAVNSTLKKGQMPKTHGSDLKGGLGTMTEVALVSQLTKEYGSPDAAAAAVRKYGDVMAALDNAPSKKMQDWRKDKALWEAPPKRKN